MKFNRKVLAALLLAVSMLVFGLFFVRVYLDEHNAIIDHQESCSAYETMTDVTFEAWGDSTAPAGVRQQYTWLCPAGEYDGASIAFFLVHQSAQVYYNDEMVYSISPEADNTLTNTPGSNWVMLPLHEPSHDCEVRIVVTPYYPDITDRQLEIMVGSLYSIFLDVLQENLMYVLLSLLTMLVGAIMLGTCMYNAFMRRKVDATVVYLGVTMILIGIWRITDTRLSAFLFPGNVLALDYITVGTLFLICISFGLATRTRIRRHMYLASVLSAVIALGVMLGHMVDWWDLRAMLAVSHVMIVFNSALLIIAEVILLVRNRTLRQFGSLALALAPLVGALADIVHFYASGSSAEMFFVIVGSLTYAGCNYGADLRDARRKMFYDEQTGLFNRARWETLMERTDAGSCGMILFDMNRLKHVNDSYGHAAGDTMICGFADILREAMGPGQTICRWGGDEFAVYVPGASEAMMQRLLQRVQDAVEQYNRYSGDLYIRYASGYAIGSEAPDLPPRELFRIADKRMYANKQSSGVQR